MTFNIAKLRHANGKEARHRIGFRREGGRNGGLFGLHGRDIRASRRPNGFVVAVCGPRRKVATAMEAPARIAKGKALSCRVPSKIVLGTICRGQTN